MQCECAILSSVACPALPYFFQIILKQARFSKQKSLNIRCVFRLYINYQLDALIIIYSQNTILLYMFRASSAHLQEDIVVYKQHMVPSLPIRVPGGLSISS